MKDKLFVFLFLSMFGTVVLHGMEFASCVQNPAQVELKLSQEFIVTKAQAWLHTFNLEYGSGCEEFFEKDLRTHFDVILRIKNMPSTYDRERAITLCLNPTYARDHLDEEQALEKRVLFHARLRNKFAQLCDELLMYEIALNAGVYYEQIGGVILISPLLQKVSQESFHDQAARFLPQQINAFLYSIAEICIKSLSIS